MKKFFTKIVALLVFVIALQQTVHAQCTVNLSANPTSICQGSGTPVTLTANAVGSVNNYVWSTGQSGGALTSVTVAPTLSSTYLVTVTGPFGCSAVNSITVNVNAAPSTTVTAAGPTSFCNGGSVILSSSAVGTAYQWYNNGTLINGATSQNYSATASGNYNVKIWNGTCNAMSTNTVTVTVTAGPTISATATPATICAGANSTLTASGASTYTWVPGNLTGTSVTVGPASTTTYTVTGTDLNNCSNTANVTVTVNQLPAVTAVAAPPAICAGNSSTLTASGASSYSWGGILGNGATKVVTPPITTTYTVTGTDGNNCTNTANVTVTVNQPPTVSATATPPAICAGSSATITAAGASTYAWSNGLGNGATKIVSPNTTTTYVVTCTDINNCVSTASVTVTVYQLPTIITTATPTTICAGTNSTLNASGASTYTWNNGLGVGATKIVSPATTTTYMVTGTDGNNCTNTANIIVTVNQSPIVSATATPQVICAGSSTTITAAGASTYAWNNGLGSGATHIVSPASTTTYTVTGTDGNNCINTANVTVTVNPLPTIIATATPAMICAGTNSTLAAIGANTYVWMPGTLTGSTFSISPVSTTTYTVTGTDGNNCINTASVTVTVNPLPIVSATATPTTICIGSNATLTAIGANTYAWSNGLGSGNTKIVSPSSTTTYTVTGTDTNNCTASANVTVTVNTTIPVVAISVSPNDTICQLASTTLTASGATSYLWNTGATTSAITVMPLTTTTYTVTGTFNVCTATASMTITVLPLPSAAGTIVGPTTVCHGQVVTYSIAPIPNATNYVWSCPLGATITGSGTTISVTYGNTSISGNVTVYGVGTCGNGQAAHLAVSVNPIPTAAIIPSAQTLCFGTATNLAATGGGSYLWNTGATNNFITVTPGLGISTYSVTVTGAGGCTASATASIAVNPKPTVAVSPQNQVVCSGTPVQLTASGATTYLWNTGAITSFINATLSGTYVVVGSNIWGCSDTAQTTVTVNASPILSTSVSPAAICAGSSAILTAGGATSYTWQPGNLTGSTVTVAPGVTTTYTVTGSTGNGCFSTTTATVTVHPNPTFTTLAPLNPACEGTELDFNAVATPTSTYVWTGPNGFWSNMPDPFIPQVTTNDAGSYTVTATTQYGCTATVSITVTVNPTPIISVSAISPVCAGSNIYFTAAYSGNSIMWHGPNGFTSNVQHPQIANANTTMTGWYTAMTWSGTCFASDSVFVSIYPAPNVQVSADHNNICSGEGVILTATGANTYHWSTGQSGNTIVVYPQVTTTYVVTGMNISGCSATASVTVTINGNSLSSIFTSAGNVTCPSGNDGWANLSVLNGSYPYSYLWTPNPINGQGNNAITGLYAGAWTVIITDANGCHGTNTVNILQPDPFVIIPIINEQTVTAIVSGGTLLPGDSYVYNWSPSPFVGQGTPTATFLTGIHIVSLTVTDGHACQATQIIDLTTAGVDDPKSTAKLLIYPNLVLDIVHIEMGMITPSNILVVDLMGKILSSGTDRTIDMSNLPSGMYFIKIITTDGRVISTKVVKK